MELESYIQLKTPDVIALTEVLPKNSLFDQNKEVFMLHGYSCFSSVLTQGRGVLLYVKENFSAIEEVYVRNFQDAVWCKIMLRGGDKLLIGCIYKSPNSTSENTLNMFEAVRDIVSSNPSHLLIVGDFNIKEIDLTNMSTPENENHTSTLFLECLRDCFLFQHVKEPTRYRSQNVPNILDLILTNKEDTVSNLIHKPGLGKSDHVILEFTYNCYIESSDYSYNKFNFFKGNYNEIRNKLQETDWTHDLMGLSLTEAWETLTEKLIKLVEEYVPVSKVSNGADRKNPYVNRQSLIAIKKKHTKWQKFLHNKTDHNYTQYKMARNNVISELRRSKYSYEKDLASKIKTDNKLFWSYVRSKIKTKSNIGQMESIDGNYTNDNQEKAEILNSYFASVFEMEGTEVLPDFDDRVFAEPLTSIVINATKISKATDKLKASKSQGPDQIHPKLIKECKDLLLEPLETIFQKSVGTSQIPNIWKEGNITAIFKSGTKTKAENYRPISLTSVPGKLLEKLVRDEIVSHMETNNLFSTAQHGFIKGRSCSTQLLELMEELTEALDTSEDIDIIYLDFRKAFDKVPHKRLLKKLWGYGIQGKVHSWIKEFLTGRSQKVKIEGKSSKAAKVTSGIPQGSVLGPILFLVFINDLPDVIVSCMKLFADDAKIFGRVNSVMQATAVQNSLDNAVDWARMWKMNYHLKNANTYM